MARPSRRRHRPPSRRSSSEVLGSGNDAAGIGREFVESTPPSPFLCAGSSPSPAALRSLLLSAQAEASTRLPDGLEIAGFVEKREPHHVATGGRTVAEGKPRLIY